MELCHTRDFMGNEGSLFNERRTRVGDIVSIIVNLDVVLAQRKMKLKDLSEELGITVSNLSVLKSGKAKAIRFTTLDALCEALDCTPGDILQYQPSKHTEE